MKLKVIKAGLTAAIALSASHVYASAGTVNYTGEILDAACTVDVASQDQTVDLGEYSKSVFSSVGSTTEAKKFDIVLKNCPAAVTTAKVRFDGKPETSDSTLLALDNTVYGAATGVAINLMTADKTQLPLHGSNNYSYTLSSSQDNTLAFYAQYKSTSTTVVAGKANSAAQFSVIYN